MYMFAQTDWVAVLSIIKDIITVIGGVVIAVITLLIKRKISEVAHQTNSMKDELVSAKEVIAEAKGLKEGIAQGRHE